MLEQRIKGQNENKIYINQNSSKCIDKFKITNAEIMAKSWSDTLNSYIRSSVTNPLADRNSQNSVYSAQNGTGLFVRNLCDGIQDNINTFGESSKPFREILRLFRLLLCTTV